MPQIFKTHVDNLYLQWHPLMSLWVLEGVHPQFWLAAEANGRNEWKQLNKDLVESFAKLKGLPPRDAVWYAYRAGNDKTLSTFDVPAEVKNYASTRVLN